MLVNRLGSCAQQMGNYAITVEEKQVQQVLKASELITDEKTVSVSQEVNNYQQSSSYDSASVYSSPNSSTQAVSSTAPSQQASGETDLQRRLRLMRERRAQGGGGFLPG